MNLFIRIKNRYVAINSILECKLIISKDQKHIFVVKTTYEEILLDVKEDVDIIKHIVSELNLE